MRTLWIAVALVGIGAIATPAIASCLYLGEPLRITGTIETVQQADRRAPVKSLTVGKAVKPGCIVVEVLDPQCQPLRDIEVRAQRPGTRPHTARTDDRGGAVLCDLPTPSTYTVSTSARGMTSFHTAIRLNGQHGAHLVGQLDLAPAWQVKVAVPVAGDNDDEPVTVNLHGDETCCTSPTPTAGTRFQFDLDGGRSCRGLPPRNVSHCWRPRPDSTAQRER